MQPFLKGDTFSTFRYHIEQITNEIKNLDNEYVIRTSQAELENYYTEKVKIDPLILYTEDYYIENQSGISLDVSHDFNRNVFPGQRAIIKGTSLDIAIPYNGDKLLWEIRPSTFSLSGYPEIQIKNDRISFSVRFPDDSVDASKLKAEISENVQRLSNAVMNLKNDVDNHNRTAPQTIIQTIQRKYHLAQSAIGAVSALGIPMQRREKPLTYVAPTIKRVSPIRKPIPSTERYEAEPILDEAEYQYILNIMRSMSLVIERSPASFMTLDEEAIRTHFLLQLNGHYEGGASGETFNAAGKTDILIRVNNKNIFIAECKFWRGQKVFNDTIDQLLGYLSWRDTKCAILVFNKTKDTSGIRSKMHQIMESRSEHRKTVCYSESGDSRYIFIKKDEPGREIIITTQIYDIPINSDK